MRLGPPRALRADERQEVEVDSREVYRIGLRTMEGLNYEAARGAPLNLRNARLLVTSHSIYGAELLRTLAGYSRAAMLVGFSTT